MKNGRAGRYLAWGTPGPRHLRRVLEAIPNVSEGRRPAVVDALTAAAGSTPGAHLLHRDVGADANRTVFTVAGEPAAVVACAKTLARAAVELVDLRGYGGTHPYLGALDVCPFVALGDTPPRAALAAAAEVSAFLAGELGVPVYAYEGSASRPHLRRLADVRRGGLAAVAARARADAPDYGGPLPHPTAGVSVVGARGVLVAYNVNLAAPAGAPEARAVARAVREVGGGPRALPGVRAIGWWQEALGCAQVSCNLTDARAAGPYDVYEAVRAEARARGCGVAGSELIGLVPRAVLAAAGRRVDAGVGDDDERAAELAAAHLGLASVRPWRPRERVLEWAWEDAVSAAGARAPTRPRRRPA